MAADSMLMGRFTVWTESLPISALGGCCAITGKSPAPGERFVETGFEVTDSTPNGDVCLAVEYVEEMARGVGMVDLARHEAVVESLAEALEEIDTLRAEIAYREQVAPEAVAIADLARMVEEMVAQQAEVLAVLPKPKPGRKITPEPKSEQETR